MMTSSNGSIFRVTGHLCGELTGLRWIPRTMASDADGAFMFSLICVWINGWVNNRQAGDLGRYWAHYDVTVMSWLWVFDWQLYWKKYFLFRVTPMNQYVNVHSIWAFPMVIKIHVGLKRSWENKRGWITQFAVEHNRWHWTESKSNIIFAECEYLWNTPTWSHWFLCVYIV